MDQAELHRILNHGESQTSEFKQSLSLQKEGLEDLCGMLNAAPAYGAVIFGVSAAGLIVGVEAGNLDKAQRSIFQQIEAKFEPRLRFEVMVFEEADGRLLVLEAWRSLQVPYHELDGRAFIREGTVTRQLSLQEKQSLQRMRNRDLHPGPWQCDRCGAWAGMLAGVLITAEGVTGKSYACGCGGEYWPAR